MTDTSKEYGTVIPVGDSKCRKCGNKRRQQCWNYLGSEKIRANRFLRAG